MHAYRHYIHQVYRYQCHKSRLVATTTLKSCYNSQYQHRHFAVAMTEGSTTDAIQLLKASTYFHESSDSLLQELAAKMVPVKADQGHIFVDEGQEMKQILILEEGTLIRTKLSVPANDVPSVRSARQDLSVECKVKHIAENSITVDKLEGRGRITGLLHSCQPESLAYATVSAVTPAKVWLLEATDFRTIVSQSPAYSLELLAALAIELRAGSKSLRGLLQKVKTNDTTSGENGGIPKTELKILCYDTTSWVEQGFQPAVAAFNKAQVDKHAQGNGSSAMLELQMDFTSDRLSEKSAMYAAGYDAVCLFVNDVASEQVLQTLSLLNVKLVAMRCAGFDRVNGKAALAYGFTVARVPAYSPYAVAEMAVALLMAINRKIDRASARIKMANFTLDAGLMGMDIHGKTVAVMGTGKIGQILCRIMLGFGAHVICYDIYESDELKAAGCQYVSKEEIYQRSDVIFLMMPLLKPTYHTIDESAIQQMKEGVLLINTSRGGLMDTKAVLTGIRDGIIGGVGMDVYEYEEAYFFQDWSAKHIQDQDLLALIGENNVIMTAHQAFFTKEAVDKIIETTIDNLADFAKGMTGLSHPNNCLPTK